MKKTIKLISFFIVIAIITLILPIVSNAETPITDENSLISAISSADSGATVKLDSNITVKAPIVIAKELTIDGNGYTVTGSSEWTSTSGNQTMFTAQFSDAKLTLKNINLQNGPKYGVQSYDGATVILDNVSINGFKYGAVLANGGKVEVRKLHLGYNGTNANNGIEIDKGASATNNPTLVMNGTLTTDTNENVVRAAENGHLTEFTVTNTENTTNKVVIAGGNVVLTDSENNIISETKVPEKATVNTDTQSVVITLIANEQTNRIVVNLNETITADFLKTHIEIEENYVIEGFYTDAQYTNEFNFSNPVSADTTIYPWTVKTQYTVDKDGQIQVTVNEAVSTPTVYLFDFLPANSYYASASSSKIADAYNAAVAAWKVAQASGKAEDIAAAQKAEAAAAALINDSDTTWVAETGYGTN